MDAPIVGVSIMDILTMDPPIVDRPIKGGPIVSVPFMGTPIVSILIKGMCFMGNELAKEITLNFG